MCQAGISWLCRAEVPGSEETQLACELGLIRGLDVRVDHGHPAGEHAGASQATLTKQLRASIASTTTAGGTRAATCSAGCTLIRAR